MIASHANGRLFVRLLPALAAAAVLAAGTVPAPSVADSHASGGPVLLVPPALAEPARTREEGVAPLETEAGHSTEEAEPLTPQKTARQESVQKIEVNTLAEIEPDSIGVLDPDDGGFGIEMWRGSNREVITSLLRRLPDDMNSRNMRVLARRLLMSIATPPEVQSAEGKPPTDAPLLSLLMLRVERLAALGEVKGLNDLLSVVPRRHDDEVIARVRVNGLLLAKSMDEACRLVRNGITNYHQKPYWQRAMILCQMVDGEVDKAMLGLDLLREQGMTDDPVFFALAQIFFGAEADIPSDAKTTPLHFAMIQATGAPLPAGLIDRVSPAILLAIATAPNVELEQRARAAELACAKGLLEGAVLAEVYGNFNFSADELANAISASESLDGPRLRALLYQAARGQTLPATRAEVLRVALDQAEKAGLYQAVVPVLLPLLEEIDVSPELAWFAGPAGRALYAAGRYEQASAWLALGRQEAIINPQASTAAAALWPYSRLAGGSSLTTDGSLASWGAMRKTIGDDALEQRQTLLRASFQALGVQDPMPWSVIAADGAPAPRFLPNAALLYALEEASESQRIGETVLLALVVLGEDGPGKSHTIALSAVLSALGRIGLEQEARNLAIEAALANGV